MNSNNLFYKQHRPTQSKLSLLNRKQKDCSTPPLFTKPDNVKSSTTTRRRCILESSESENDSDSDSCKIVTGPALGSKIPTDVNPNEPVIGSSPTAPIALDHSYSDTDGSDSETIALNKFETKAYNSFQSKIALSNSKKKKRDSKFQNDAGISIPESSSSSFSRTSNKIKTSKRMDDSETRDKIKQEKSYSGSSALHKPKQVKRERLSSKSTTNKQTHIGSPFQVMGCQRYINLMEHLYKNDNKHLKRLYKSIIGLGNEGNLEAITKVLQNLPNVGGFYAWQILCDLMESGLIQGCQEDTSNWVELGPGAQHGIDYIFNVGKRREDIYYCNLLRDTQNDLYHAMQYDFQQFDGRIMPLKVLEHALCEFYKYTECIRKGGNAKGIRKYSGDNGKTLKQSVKSDVSLKGRCDTCWKSMQESSVCTDCRKLCDR